MGSLKRILRDDEDFQVSPFRKRIQETAVGGEQHSEPTVLLDTSWDEMINQLLSSDFSDGRNYFDINSTEYNDSTLYFPQDSIEQWGSQFLPLTESLLPQTELISVASTHSTNTTTTTTTTTEEVDLEILCYGMIDLVAIKLVGDMSEVDAKLLTDNTCLVPGHYAFRMEKSGENIFLLYSDGTQFGIVNNRTQKGLETVVMMETVELEPLANVSIVREVIGRAAKASDAIARVSINVYGPMDKRDLVGKLLSEKRVYLQHPDHPRTGYTYDNPHVLKFPGMEKQGIEHTIQVAGKRTSKPEHGKDFKNAVSNVYSSLTRSTNLKRVAGDKRLRTTLLPHQEEALDFMTQRETGPIPKEFCLWQPVEIDGQEWYRHAITKAKTRADRAETGGGILADEMGMGKSLCILSLVVKTIQEAHQWAERKRDDLTENTGTAKRYSRATLIVVSSALLINNWLKEIETHLDGKISIMKYHGQKRETHLSIITDHDLVLTTYHTLAIDLSSKSSPLHDVSWFRIVLDEAHIIRRQVTSLYRTVWELSAHYRWCLTGTPIQNRLEDIGSLFTFIRACPFDSMAVFRRFISIPFDEGEENRELATQRLKLLIDALCLRRTTDRLQLPDRIERLRILKLSQEERGQYENIKKTMIRAIKESAAGMDRKRMFGMFQAQLQLRILCNHGTYQHHFSWAKRSLLNEREDALCAIERNLEVNCSSCRQTMPILGSNKVYRKYAQNCTHSLCVECLAESTEGSSPSEDSVPQCPICTSMGITNETPFASAEEQTDEDYFRSEGYSAKMTSLISDVQQDLWETKSIIFSCWTRTLNLISLHLKQKSIPFVRIDGESPLPRRQKILDDFESNKGTPVLIMTTGTGAYGLNLTSANRVFIVEPQWNPSVENQAIARALRLGQGQSVQVTRYVTEQTVEQEMRSQQKQKLRIAEIGR